MTDDELIAAWLAKCAEREATEELMRRTPRGEERDALADREEELLEESIQLRRELGARGILTGVAAL